MTDTPEHYAPIGKAEILAIWRRRMRIPVPTRDVFIADLRIVAIYETTAVNGEPLDLLIEAQETVSDPVMRFGVRRPSSNLHTGV